MAVTSSGADGKSADAKHDDVKRDVVDDVKVTPADEAADVNTGIRNTNVDPNNLPPSQRAKLAQEAQIAALEEERRAYVVRGKASDDRIAQVDESLRALRASKEKDNARQNVSGSVEKRDGGK